MVAAYPASTTVLVGGLIARDSDLAKLVVEIIDDYVQSQDEIHQLRTQLSEVRTQLSQALSELDARPKSTDDDADPACIMAPR